MTISLEDVTTMAKNSKDSQTKQSLQIPIRWGSANHLQTVYANNVFITHAGGKEFFLVFGELTPPVDILNTNSPPEYVEITPVVRIALTPESMIQITEAMSGNLESYIQKMTEAEGDDNDEADFYNNGE